MLHVYLERRRSLQDFRLVDLCVKNILQHNPNLIPTRYFNRRVTVPALYDYICQTLPDHRRNRYTKPDRTPWRHVDEDKVWTADDVTELERRYMRWPPEQTELLWYLTDKSDCEGGRLPESVSDSVLQIFESTEDRSEWRGAWRVDKLLHRFSLHVPLPERVASFAQDLKTWVKQYAEGDASNLRIVFWSE